MQDTHSPDWRNDVIQDFARSELFERTFQEGMELVEETAAYLDGGGRQESKLLSRNAALAYAAESMRLTTRLMQVASWLLVQRAVREGNMVPAAACEDRYRLNADAVTRAEVLARIEAERCSVSPCSCLDVTNLSAVGLGGILEQEQTALMTELCDGRHVSQLAVEMNREHRFYVGR